MEAALKAAGFRVAPHWPSNILPQINQLRNWYANLNTPHIKLSPKTHQVMLRPSSKTGHYINVFFREIAPAGHRPLRWKHLESIRTPADQKLVSLFDKTQTSVSKFDKTQAWTKMPTTINDQSTVRQAPGSVRQAPGSLNINSIISQSVNENLINLASPTVSSSNNFFSSARIIPASSAMATGNTPTASQNLQINPDGIFSCGSQHSQ